MLHVHANYSDRFVDLVGEGFDAGVRMGYPADSNLVPLRIWAIRGKLVASPGYIAAHGAPETPDDLLHHETLMQGTSPGASSITASPSWCTPAAASRLTTAQLCWRLRLPDWASLARVAVLWNAANPYFRARLQGDAGRGSDIGDRGSILGGAIPGRLRWRIRSCGTQRPDALITVAYSLRAVSRSWPVSVVRRLPSVTTFAEQSARRIGGRLNFLRSKNVLKSGPFETDLPETGVEREVVLSKAAFQTAPERSSSIACSQIC